MHSFDNAITRQNCDPAPIAPPPGAILPFSGNAISGTVLKPAAYKALAPLAEPGPVRLIRPNLILSYETSISIYQLDQLLHGIEQPKARTRITNYEHGGRLR
jgi:hypothetical protein